MKNLLVIGSINMDLVVKSDQLPKPGETLMGTSMETIPGGKGANQAVAAARLGAGVTMIGAVGNDGYGPLLLEGLKKESINVDYVAVEDNISSGIAIIHVDKAGENSISVVPGSNACLSRDTVKARSEQVGGADVMLVQLEVPLETIEEAISVAKSSNTPVVLDPAPVPTGLFPEFLYNVDVFTPNQSETLALTGIRVVDKASATLAGLVLLDRGAKYVVIKAGDLGAFIVTSGSDAFHIPVFPSSVVDTTAAGDAFSAALALGLAEGKPLVEATRWACAAGSIAVSRAGAQPAMPRREEVDAIVDL
ncbi:MAG: ribokinase [Rhodothermaceae bacterium]|nr:ribokinase [Rhodothermaceae bacterium]